MSLPRQGRDNRERAAAGGRWLVLLLALWLAPTTVWACRFNVRDVGFVDLETEPYRFCVLVGSETPAEIVALLRQMPAIALRDCNIQVDIASASSATNHPAFSHRPEQAGPSLRHAVLVSPDGQALPLSLDDGNRPFRETLAARLDDIASSPKREELVTASIRSFAAVLLVEGETPAANQRARQAASRAIESIRSQMQSLPKPIAAPPALVVLEAADLARERILLWSLRLDTARTDQPRAAIVYGRARWMGPLMRGDEISERNLSRLLSIIGADCECGLDVAWTLGTRLPVRWNELRHAEAAKALGFDPESPLVKVEVGRIAARAGSPGIESATAPTVVLSSDPRPGAGSASARATQRPAPAQALRSRATPSGAATTGDALVWSRALRFLAVMALLVLSASLFLLWKAARRRPQ